LNGVVGVKGVGNPVLAVVVSTSSYLHFISYTMMLASFSTIGLDQRRLSSCIVSWISGGIPLDDSSIGYVVSGIINSIGRSVHWSISRRVRCSVSCSIGSGVDRLCYFVFASSLFSHRSRGPWLRCRWQGRSDLLLE
jgi:hypothetical protein